MRKGDLFLQHGIMGYAIFCFWYGRLKNDNKYTEIAERCLMHVCKSVNDKCSLGVFDGLSGIGISICYLCAEDYLQGNPDGLLQSIDDYMFKVIQKGLQQEHIEDEKYMDSLLDVMLYINVRLRTEIRKPYEKHILELFFIKILNWLYQNAGSLLFEEPLPANLSYRLAKFFFVLGYACDLNFYNYRIKRIIKEIETVVLSRIPYSSFNRLTLYCSLSILTRQIRLGERWTLYIETLKNSISIEEILCKEIKSYNMFFFDGLGSVYLLYKYCNKNGLIFDVSEDCFIRKLQASEIWKMLDDSFDYKPLGLDGFLGLIMVFENRLNFFNTVNGEN